MHQPLNHSKPEPNPCTNHWTTRNQNQTHAPTTEPLYQNQTHANYHWTTLNQNQTHWTTLNQNQTHAPTTELLETRTKPMQTTTEPLWTRTKPMHQPLNHSKPEPNPCTYHWTTLNQNQTHAPTTEPL